MLSFFMTEQDSFVKCSKSHFFWSLQCYSPIALTVVWSYGTVIDYERTTPHN